MCADSLFLPSVCWQQALAIHNLVANRQKAKKDYPHALVVPASIDDIMLLYVKGEH